MQENLCERALRYARNLEKTLASTKQKLDKKEYKYLIDAIERYLKDAYYFADINDCATSLVSVSYAEGLLDSLKYLGVLEPKWFKETEPAKKVFVGGTFDLIHPGHISLLKYASKLGKVYVVIARDENVKKTKGKKPILSEESRLKIVSSIRYVYEARLGDLHDKMRPLKDISPDIVVLGPDQPYDPEELSEKLRELIGKEVKVIRYKEKEEYEPGARSSSDLIKKICCGSYCTSIGCKQDTL